MTVTHTRAHTSGRPASCARAPPQPPCAASHARACRTEHDKHQHQRSAHINGKLHVHICVLQQHADAWLTLLGQVSGHVLKWTCSRPSRLGCCLPVALGSLHSRLLLKLLLLSKLPAQGRHSVQQDTADTVSWSDRPGEHFHDASGARQRTKPGCCWAPAQAPHSRSHLLQLPLPLGRCPGLLMLDLLAPQLSSACLQHTKHVHGRMRHVLTAPPWSSLSPHHAHA